MQFGNMLARLGGAAAGTLRTVAENKVTSRLTQFGIKQESQNAIDIQNTKNIQTLLQSLAKYAGTLYEDLKRGF